MIFDFHNDFLTSDKFFQALKQYQKSNNFIVAAIFRGQKDYICAKQILNNYQKLKAENIFFSFEDFGYEEDLPNLIFGLIDYGPIYIGLTWNYENNLAYGVYSSGKIKPRGVEIIKEMNKRNIVLDTAHLSKQSFYDAFNYTDKIICSHSAIYEVNQHVRNLDSDQIKKIIEVNGLFGLTLYSPFLTSKLSASLFDLYIHIDYFANKFGIDNLCLGTDYYGCDSFPKGCSNYLSLEKNLTTILIKNGFTKDDVEKILYKNLLNWFINNKMIKKVEKLLEK